MIRDDERETTFKKVKTFKVCKDNDMERSGIIGSTTTVATQNYHLVSTQSRASFLLGSTTEGAVATRTLSHRRYPLRR